MMMLDADALNDTAEHAADFLRTVAHPGRLRIICALLEGELTAGRLAGQALLSAPALSQQAAILEAGGLISRRRNARSILYRLAAPEAKAIADLLYRLFCKGPRASSKRRGTSRPVDPPVAGTRRRPGRRPS